MELQATKRKKNGILKTGIRSPNALIRPPYLLPVSAFLSREKSATKWAHSATEFTRQATRFNQFGHATERSGSVADFDSL